MTECAEKYAMVANLASKLIDLKKERGEDISVEEALRLVERLFNSDKVTDKYIEEAVCGVSKPSAIHIKNSVTKDYIVSFEDGKQYKSLKRHLTVRGLTPEGYRNKWSLPNNYPLVCENYSKQRSELAKSMGLGTMRKKNRGDD